MQELDYSYVKAGNLRLLYKWSPVQSLSNWIGESSILEDFIGQCPQLQLADSYTYLTFFSDPAARGLDQGEDLGQDLWVGRSVLGYVDLEDHEEMSLQDFSSVLLLSFPLQVMGGWPSLQVRDIGKRKKLALSALLERGLALSPLWRIRIQVGESNDGVLNIQGEFNFFLKDPLLTVPLQRKSRR